MTDSTDELNACNRHSASGCHKHAAVTLLEILIVVAIVSVLAALLFPAFKNALQASYTTRCAGNLRAIGTALQQCQSDNNGWIPSLYYPAGNTNFDRYLGVLAPYLLNEPRKTTFNEQVIDSREAFGRLLCPAISKKYAYQNASYGDYFLTYAINNFAPYPNNTVTVLKISQPAHTIYLTDGYYRFIPGIDGEDQGYPPTVMPPPNGGDIYFPHAGSANALFLDGHVESFRKSIPQAYLNAYK